MSCYLLFVIATMLLSLVVSHRDNSSVGETLILLVISLVPYANIALSVVIIIYLCYYAYTDSKLRKSLDNFLEVRPFENSNSKNKRPD